MRSEAPPVDTKLQQRSPRPPPPAPVPDHTSQRQLSSSRWPLEQPEPATQFSLRDYWRLIHGRRRTILWVVVSSLLATTIYNYLRVPTYRAKATIRIDREEPNIAQLDESLPQLSEQPDYIETQYKLLKSRTLAKRVISKLGLDEQPEFRQSVGRDTPASDHQAEIDAHKQIHAMIVENYLDRLGVHPGKGTRLVDVTFESVDRELAPKVVNTLAEEYIEYNFEAKWNATQKASTWLEQQLSHLQAKLAASESDLQDYAAAHSILFVEERKNITTEKLAQLEEELTRVQALRIEQQSRAMLAEDALARGAELPSTLTSETYRRIESELTELRRDYSQLTVTFAPGYPKVRRVKRQIDELQQALQAEQARTFRGVSESFQLAVRRERLLEDEVARQRGLVNRLSDDFIEYDILKRDAETNRQLYEGLLQRLKEAGISAGLRASNIAVLDVAEAPDEPYQPKKLYNLSMALLAGEPRRGQPDRTQEAFDLWRENLAQDPEYSPSRISLARALSRSGESSEAIRQYAAIVEALPNYVAARLALAELHEKASDPEAALEQLNQARARQPENAVIFEQIGDLEQARGRTAQASDAYESALQYAPDRKTKKRLRKKLNR